MADNITILDSAEVEKTIATSESAGVHTNKHQLVDADGQTAKFDDSTSALNTVDYSHHEIHNGSSYVVTDVQGVNDTIIQWQITTPAGTKYSHTVFDIHCSGEMMVTITEGSDRTDGTALSEINRRRTGTPNVAGTIVTRTPTGGSSDGVTIFQLKAGASGKEGQLGTSRNLNEFVLAANTKYIVAVETFDDVDVSFGVDWYEHTDAL